MIEVAIPTYDPEDPESNDPFDWEAYYRGEDPRVPGDRPVTAGHEIAATSWPREASMDEIDVF